MAESGEPSNDAESDAEPVESAPKPETASAKESHKEEKSSGLSVDTKAEIKTAIATALITAVVGGGVAIAVALINRSDSGENTAGQNTSTSSTTTTAPSIEVSSDSGNSVKGSISQVAIKGETQGLTVAGRADPGIASVVVLVGPRKDVQNQFWAAEADVSDGAWSLNVETPPSLPFPFEVTAYFQNGSELPLPVGPQHCPATQGPTCFRSLGPPATYSGASSTP